MSSRMTRSRALALGQTTQAPEPRTRERQTATSRSIKPESKKASTATSTATTTTGGSKPKRPKKVHKKLTEREYHERRMSIANEYLHGLIANLGHTIVDGEVTPAHPDPTTNEALRLYLVYGITSSQNSSKATTPATPYR